MVNVDEVVADFTGKTNEGDWTLSSFSGQNLVIYFYPRDNTPRCTTESNDFNALLDDFKAKNTVIVGVSNDALKKHEGFCNKYGFNFSLIADEDKTISEQFGAYQLKKFMGKESMGIVRSTFLINTEGKLVKEWRKVKVKEHAAEVLASIEVS